MAKDERIWIPDNYYQGFLRGCMNNELIEDTPSKTGLEDAGCQISALCYLITPDGKQHNPRIMNPNELPTSVRKLFEEKSDNEPESSASVPQTLAGEVEDMLKDATYQVCDTCGENKPMEAFKKFPGRGVKRQSTCIECQDKAKAKIQNISDAKEPIKSPDQEPKAETIIIDTEIIEKRPTVCVTLDYLKKLATDAYERGREFERSNVETVEPSLDELLGIGA